MTINFENDAVGAWRLVRRQRRPGWMAPLTAGVFPLTMRF